MRTRGSGSSNGLTNFYLEVTTYLLNLYLERSHWSDYNGMMNMPKESFKLPSSAWEWEDIWHIERTPEFTDADGWSYAIDFNSGFHASKGLLDAVRRRKWVRVARLKPDSINLSQSSK
jgi:hypothetical protein